MKRVCVTYFAQLREQRGQSREWVNTSAESMADLFEELRQKHGFSLGAQQIKAARQTDFVPMDSTVNDKDVIAFIPPVAGG